MKLSHDVLLRLCHLKLPESDRQWIRQQANNINWCEILELAQRGGVAGLVARQIEGLELPAKTTMAFVKVALVTEYKNRIMMQEAIRLLSAAAAQDLVLIPLKGVALNLGQPYADCSLRTMCDLDLLFRQDQLQQAETFFEDHGYQLSISKQSAFRHHHHLSYCKEIKGHGLLVELHWKPFNYLFSGADVVRRIIERSQLTRVRDASVRMLDPEDMQLTLMVHLAAHRFRAQLKWLVDVAEHAAMHRDQICWENVWRKAKKIGAFRSVLLVSLLANQLLSASIPLPSKIPYMLSMLQRLHTPDSLITSEGQPSLAERTVSDLLSHDSALGGIASLLHKVSELLERNWNLKLPNPNKTFHR